MLPESILALRWFACLYYVIGDFGAYWMHRSASRCLAYPEVAPCSYLHVLVAGRASVPSSASKISRGISYSVLGMSPGRWSD